MGLCIAALYCGLFFGLHYLISSGSPGQMLRDFPAAAILAFLSLPISFVLGYVWGVQKDQRTSLKFLLEQQEDHIEIVESLSGFLRQGEESRRMSGIAMQEMKHPLTSIVGYALTLHQYWDRLDDDSRREFVDYIKVSASRLEGITNDLLRITEYAHVTPRLEKEKVNLGEIVDEVKHILEEIYTERNVKIGIRFPRNIPPMNSDPSRLFDLLYNLLDICMRCTDDQQIISAWCAYKDHQIQLRLRSTQSSIPQEKTMQIREWPPPDGEGEMATLGMEYRLAQHLVKEVGGKVHLDTVGKTGVSFLVSLPVD